MAGTAQFTIGAQASCSDGACGQGDPRDRRPGRRGGHPPGGRAGTPADPGRLVPLDLIDATAGEIRLRCTLAEFGKLHPAEETQFIPGTISYAGYGPGQVSYWPYYGKGTGGQGTGDVGMGGAGPGTAGLGGRGMAGQNLSQTVTWDSIPPGEVEIRRGDHVQASDGHIGRVQGLVIDRRSGHVTHVLLQEGHLWSRREVAIPVSAVAGTGDGIKLTITKQEVGDLPPVDIDHPDGSTGGREGSG